MILVVDATSKPTGHGGIINNNPDGKCRIVTGGEADEQLFEQCDSCRELDEREALEEWPEIPVLQPITIKVRKFSPETLAAVALLADGQHTDQVAKDCGVPVQAVRRFKGTHAEYIEELSNIPHGQKRFDYIQKHFGMGMPEKVSA